MTRPGGRMLAVAAFVAAHPGCSKRAAALGTGLTCYSYGGAWGPVDRAIKAGLIYSLRVHPTLCALYVPVPPESGPEQDGHWRTEAHP